MRLQACPLAAVAFLVAASPGVASAQAMSGESACAALRQIQVPGVVLSDVEARWLPAGSPPPAEPPWVPPLTVSLPSHCRLSTTIDPRTGADGKSHGIGFALALPAEWSGRFLFQGGGGLNGSVAPPLGRTGHGETALSRGFAVVTTDTGHRGEVFDASFMADQQASLDFAYQAVGRVAALAKQILELHYGKPPVHSYFMGCSTGGREGMLMAQRHPTYFDGIVVGAPAMRTSFSGIGHCGGGPATLDSFDMLGAVVDWVEGQKAPEIIRATSRTWPGRSRPLCAYPSHAHYKGAGDIEDAASFACR